MDRTRSSKRLDRRGSWGVEIDVPAIRGFMRDRVMSGKDLAAVAGVHLNTAYDVLKRGRATHRVIRLIAAALNVEPAEIVVGATPLPSESSIEGVAAKITSVRPRRKRPRRKAK